MSDEINPFVGPRFRKASDPQVPFSQIVAERPERAVSAVDDAPMPHEFARPSVHANMGFAKVKRHYRSR